MDVKQDKSVYREPVSWLTNLKNIISVCQLSAKPGCVTSNIQKFRKAA